MIWIQNKIVCFVQSHWPCLVGISFTLPQKVMKVAIVLLTILLFTYVHVRHAINGYDLPLFPTDIWKEKDIIYTNGFKDATKFIPRHVWIAVRNSSDEKPKHTAALMDKNKLWNFHFYGNEEKDEFMKKHYSGTSILWAYEILNPAIGCSRPEIWRLAILFKYGGVYMDDDSTIETELDSVVGPQDKFIGGKEPYNFDDRCYRDDYVSPNY